jgi:hypothetical protein
MVSIMNKQKFIPITLVILLFVSFVGCVETTEKKEKEIATVDINLDEVALKENDLPDSFNLLYENHTTEPTTVENQTGKGLTWHILERYDATYFKNLSNGVMETLLEIDTVENAQKLVIFSKDNLENLSYDIKQNNESIKIGNVSYLLFFNYSDENTSYTYYTYLFSIHNIFVALGGSSPEESTFIGYAKTIEQNITLAIQNSRNNTEE